MGMLRKGYMTIIILTIVMLWKILILGMTFYSFLSPPECPIGNPVLCIQPAEAANDWSYHLSMTGSSRMPSTFQYDSMPLKDPRSTVHKLNVSMPSFRNTTVFLHLQIRRSQGEIVYAQTARWSRFIVPKSTRFLGTSSSSSLDSGLSMAHVFPRVNLLWASDPTPLNFQRLPVGMGRLIKLVPQPIKTGRPSGPGRTYYPVMLLRTLDLVGSEFVMDPSTIQIVSTPAPLASVLSWSHLQHIIHGLQDTYTVKDADIDQIKEMFITSSWVLVLSSFIVAVLHVLLSFLVFKSEVSFWSSRDSLEGISIRRVVWNVISDSIILLYLYLTGEASLVILLLSFASIILGLWKVVKVYFLLNNSNFSADTDALDSLAVAKISQLVLPLVFTYAAYSLVYRQYSSWALYCAEVLAQIVYVIGFAMMTPQLYINYKLKSVSSLPWRVMTYRAFNTFVDDFFSFVVPMPMLHRLACLRDDVIFFIFLYQVFLFLFQDHAYWCFRGGFTQWTNPDQRRKPISNLLLEYTYTELVDFISGRGSRALKGTSLGARLTESQKLLLHLCSWREG